MSCSPRRALRVAALTFAALLAAAPAAAIADSTSTSANWSGYVASRPGLTFRAVSARWTQPTVTCTDGRTSVASPWIGLGGYHQTSKALEQIGTDAQCSASGRPAYSAWYELVPAASRTIRMSVSPGDGISASVQVRGHLVRLRLRDTTTGATFARVLSASAIDVSSADWILEAPSECAGGVAANACRTLPLADFGTAGFTAAVATTLAGHAGTIADSAWSRAAITLAPAAGARFGGDGPGPGAGPPDALSLAGAAPGALLAGGSAFDVTYEQDTSRG
ncbi:MAG TPA: G1 family glutamic endopeptidase [Solirubrobacteraceae bacterium]